jgi:hypothetical protein
LAFHGRAIHTALATYESRGFQPQHPAIPVAITGLARRAARLTQAEMSLESFV